MTPTRFKRCPALIAALVLFTGMGQAVELTIDQIRGTSNADLCHYSRSVRTDADEIAVEIQKRGLDCLSVLAGEGSYDYTPESPTSASSLPNLSMERDTSAITATEHPADNPARPLDEEELAHFRQSVQEEADRLRYMPNAGEFPPASSSAASGANSGSYDPPSAVVRISAGRRVGSGFYAEESLIVTNAHVVENSRSVQIAFSGRPPFPGQVVFRDADLDFAIIRPGIRRNPLPIRRGPVRLGESIVAMGFPQGRKVIAASTGTVVDVVDCCILHDALIAGGSSGGPLLDAENRVLGLNTMLSKKPGDTTNETDRAITVRMDFITDILASDQAKAASPE